MVGSDAGRTLVHRHAADGIDGGSLVDRRIAVAFGTVGVAMGMVVMVVAVMIMIVGHWRDSNRLLE